MIYFFSILLFHNYGINHSDLRHFFFKNNQKYYKETNISKGNDQNAWVIYWITIWYFLITCFIMALIGFLILVVFTQLLVVQRFGI